MESLHYIVIFMFNQASNSFFGGAPCIIREFWSKLLLFHQMSFWVHFARFVITDLYFNIHPADLFTSI